jgi:uncharacterized protein (TIGR02145 family)
MKKFLYILVLIGGFISHPAFGQNNMIIHQGNGTKIILPLQSIDSVRYQLTPPPVLQKIYQNNGNILSVSVNDIDSITFYTPNPNTLATLSTQNITVLSNSSASGGGTVLTDGGSPVLQRGVCWNTSPNPTIANNFTNDGNGIGGFLSTITPLLPSTTYYVRAYATNANGTSYGNQVVFTTTVASNGGNLPTITTSPIVYLDSLSAFSGGNITADGGLAVTARGVCWAIGTTPTINNSHTIDGAGGGSFNSRVFNLLPNTSYFVRAYATNAAGTAYGIAYSFTTKGLPTVTTNEVNTIMVSSAYVQGAVSSDGGSNVSERGVCWSTSPNPTVKNNKTIPHFAFNPFGLGMYFSVLGSLPLNTNIYARAYAVNGIGYSYGNELLFKTKNGLPSIVIDSIKHINANEIKLSCNIKDDGGATIIESGVCWSTSPNPTKNNDTINDGLNQIGTFISNPKNLTLNTNYYFRAYAKTIFGTSYSNQFTVKTKNGIPNLILDSIYQINAYDCNSDSKIIDDGGLIILRKGVCWDTIPNPTIAKFKSENNNSDYNYSLNLLNLVPNTSYYVRPFIVAIKNGQNETFYGNTISFKTLKGIPDIFLDSIYNIKQFEVRVKSSIKNNPGTPILSRGLCWDTVPNPTISDSVRILQNTTSVIDTNIIKLNRGMTYYFRAYSQTNEGLFYSNQLFFTTLSSKIYCNNIQTSVVDITSPVTGKIWMDRNLGASRVAIDSLDSLSFGDLYQGGRDTDGHQCRNSNTTNIRSSNYMPNHSDFILSTNGVWDNSNVQNYNWIYINGSNNPCPSGYRVPSESELVNERKSWDTIPGGAFLSPLKFPYSGYRDGKTGQIGKNKWFPSLNQGYYATNFGTGLRIYNAIPGATGDQLIGNVDGMSVRCIKNEGTIMSIDCQNSINLGNLTADSFANSVSSIISYSGGDNGYHLGQVVSSTGITGLTATLSSGNFANGSGTLAYTITGKPSYGGIAQFNINIGGKSCVLSRFVDTPTVKILNFDCNNQINIGRIDSGQSVNNCSSKIKYFGANGGKIDSQTINSTGIGGLTALIIPGISTFDSGFIDIVISGTPINGGDTAYFNINIGGKTCILKRYITPPYQYPNSTVFCTTVSKVISDVTNPITGRTWMDRNLGASRVALSSNDSLAFGDLYQWGRRADGHQCRNSDTISVLSSTDQPNHAKFILSSIHPFDWRTPQNNNLWQGVNGINNPCPNGYRIPSEFELFKEFQSWSQKNSFGAFNSPLKFTVAWKDSFNYYYGRYWSSTFNGNFSRSLLFTSSPYLLNYIDLNKRFERLSVRCIKEEENIDTANISSINNCSILSTGNLYVGVTATNVTQIINLTVSKTGNFKLSTISNGISFNIDTFFSALGPQNVILYATGTPLVDGNHIFTINNSSICSFSRTVLNNCGVNTAVVDIVSPTGKTWMDRNLGATRVAIGVNDSLAFGDLYQWGRRADGHQCRSNISFTSQNSSIDQPTYGNFIQSLFSSIPDWRLPQNSNLWQGITGVNNPCPQNYRLPTSSELNFERLVFSTQNNIGAFNSILKLPYSLAKNSDNGTLDTFNKRSIYWSSDEVLSSNFYSNGSLLTILLSKALVLDANAAVVVGYYRNMGGAVRCIKNEVSSGGTAVIASIDSCNIASIGNMKAGISVNGVSQTIKVNVSQIGSYSFSAVSNGITFSSNGTFTNLGANTITLSATGTPLVLGTHTYILNSTPSCSFTRFIDTNFAIYYPSGSVFCSQGASKIVDVVSPTGKTWMDRNLGASRVATAFNDTASYGDLYQWGRRSDGHQCRNSGTTSILSNIDQPAHNNFITASNMPLDWRSPQNSNLWQGASGINNPCPIGYRLPTITELSNEVNTWSSQNVNGAFNSPLKIPASGVRSTSGALFNQGTVGQYNSSNVITTGCRHLYFQSNVQLTGTGDRGAGRSVRCIKN